MFSCVVGMDGIRLASIRNQYTGDDVGLCFSVATRNATFQTLVRESILYDEVTNTSQLLPATGYVLRFCSVCASNVLHLAHHSHLVCMLHARR